MGIVKKILKIFLMIVFLVCTYLLVKLLIIDPYTANKATNEIKKLYYDDEISLEDRFKALAAINPDIVGWIFISNTNIDYPVLYNEDDPSYYLHHNYKREISRYGSIYIDSACKIREEISKNIIIHGHHMRDKSMFADILKFSDIDFYKENPVIEFDTAQERANWKIISLFKTNTLPSQGKIFNYCIPSFKNSEAFLKFVNEIRIRSLIDTPVDVNEEDSLITLSTCSYEFEDFRTVLVARKVRPGEDRFVDTSTAKKASNPLMPACHYERYGGAPPAQ